VLGDNDPSSVAAVIGVPTMVLGSGFSVPHRPIDRASDPLDGPLATAARSECPYDRLSDPESLKERKAVHTPRRNVYERNRRSPEPALARRSAPGSLCVCVGVVIP